LATRNRDRIGLFFESLPGSLLEAIMAAVSLVLLCLLVGVLLRRSHSCICIVRR
jgi:hypothetical protein